VRGKREDVGDHPTVGEDLRWVANGIDEGLVESTLRGYVADMTEEGRALLGQPGSYRQDAFATFDLEVVGAPGDRRVPHGHLAHEPREQGTQGGILVDDFDRDLDRGIERLVGQGRGSRDHLTHEPDVVLDHLGQQFHGTNLRSCG
jgi:hypothetical protein